MAFPIGFWKQESAAPLWTVIDFDLCNDDGTVLATINPTYLADTDQVADNGGAGTVLSTGGEIYVAVRTSGGYYDESVGLDGPTGGSGQPLLDLSPWTVETQFLDGSDFVTVLRSEITVTSTSNGNFTLWTFWVPDTVAVGVADAQAFWAAMDS